MLYSLKKLENSCKYELQCHGVVVPAESPPPAKTLVPDKKGSYEKSQNNFHFFQGLSLAVADVFTEARAFKNFPKTAPASTFCFGLSSSGNKINSQNIIPQFVDGVLQSVY